MLTSHGWSAALQSQFEPFAAQGLVPARVILQQRGLWGLATEAGERRARVSGKLASEAEAGGLPVAGDFVAASLAGEEDFGLIHHVLPRKSAFTRKAAGPAGGVQVVAANIDVAFVTASLNGNINARRLERYLASAWASGAAPVVLLTKADLADDAEARVSAVEAVAVGAPVLAVSALTGEGLDTVREHLGAGVTAVLVGSSGVGKSTLVNALLGQERMDTGAIREDDARGRHTTSHRELILLPGGGLLLDTPGMRELGLWDAEEGVAQAFEDIEALARQCRFTDCSHGNEPGCAVRAAMEAGDLDEDRWRAFQKLGRELAFEARKEDPALRAANRRLWAGRAKANRAREKARGWD